MWACTLDTSRVALSPVRRLRTDQSAFVAPVGYETKSLNRSRFVNLELALHD